MNKEQIWEVLQTCHLASYGKSYDELVNEGFDSSLAKVGVQLYSYLHKKETE